MKSNILRSKIIEALKKLGLSFEKGWRMRGDSGIIHSFDLRVYSKLSKVIVIEVVNNLADERAVLKFYIRLYDTNLVGFGVMISDRFTEEAKKLAKAYKITLIARCEFEKLTRLLKERLL
jgi:hypothetical protein